jgi:hypothetical protein
MSNIETDKTPTPKAVKRGANDPNTIAPDFPNESQRPDTVFHGGSGKSAPPKQKTATKTPDPSMDGRGIHDASGSYTHRAGMNPASQPPPANVPVVAPKRKGD